MSVASIPLLLQLEPKLTIGYPYVYLNYRSTAMKKYYTLTIAVVILTAANLFNFNTPPPKSLELEAIQKLFHDGLLDLKQSIEAYQSLVNNFESSEVSVAQLHQQHLATRESFKAVEFLLAYLDHESINRFLNGAPLPKTEPKVPEIRIIEPKGLQVLDELVFSEDPQASIAEITKQIDKLEYNYRYVYTYQRGIQLKHRQIFEAIRQELVRVITLGLTGFDTPGSANAIPEAKSAIKSLEEAFSVYLPKIIEKDKPLGDQVRSKFSEAIQYLEQHQDFDTFDRLLYLKEFINPLYGLMYVCHRKLGIETMEEVNRVPQPTNYHSRNLFADDFFDVGYFANMNYSDPAIEKRIELGRTLFYDPILSSNNQGACASCHNPQKGFTDGLKKSNSLTGEAHLLRNAPTVINAVYAEKYFYDLRETILDRQIKHVIRDRKEFATNFIEIIEKLNQSREYQSLFKESFPKVGISAHSISTSLSAYVASLRSFNSPFDQYVKEEVAHIDEGVIRGFNLFMGKAACGTCHFAPTFNGTVPPLYRESESEVLGVPASTDTINPSIDPDLGRIASKVPIDEAPFYQYSFKTTTVRNVALTAPYMHNGIYETLEEVIDFYNRGGGAGLGLDLEYQTLPDTPLNLNEQEKQDLITFMEALTDTTGMTTVPNRLPVFEDNPEWNDRTIGGNY